MSDKYNAMLQNLVNTTHPPLLVGVLKGELIAAWMERDIAKQAVKPEEGAVVHGHKSMETKYPARILGPGKDHMYVFSGGLYYHFPPDMNLGEGSK